jgi:hypothetical protein
MRTKVVLLSLIVLVALPSISIAQDEDVRGAFLTTRPQATGSASGEKSGPATKPSRRRPKVVQTKNTDTNSKNTGTNDPKKTGETATTPLNVARLGLGLTLFQRNAQGLAVRTDPVHEFQKGDHVRFLIETSSDGYLYIFNSTDGAQPVMIYPDPELDEAGNYFQAHVPFEIPSSTAPEERLRWLTFDATPGTEKVYFVFTREPLTSVPIEDDLITLCREKTSSCPWRPGTDAWAVIESAGNEPVKIARSDSMTSAQTASERRAATRGIGLNRDDPEPSLIMLSGSTAKNILVVSLNLVHKAPGVDDSNGTDE